MWANIFVQIAIALIGLEAGALLFVSAVSVRTIQQAISKKNVAFIKQLFPVWWPYGRDLMAPLGICVALTNVLAAYVQINDERVAGAVMHGYTAIVAILIILWTVFVMGEDIDALRSGNDEHTIELASDFCAKHHYRCLASASAFLAVLATNV